MTKVTPKKYLGQHFLKDKDIARKIVESLGCRHQKVLEIGSGTGALTKHLLDKLGNKLLAIDIDTNSIEFLRQKYPHHAHQFICKDFLKHKLNETPCAIIGNFPYHVSSQFLFKIWEERNKVNEVVCMLQKEVAERIVAKSGSKAYGILSVLLQAFYTIDYLLTVPPHAFYPPPKVWSAVIRLTRNDISHLPCDEKLFKNIIKAGFGKRRKTLRNALKEIILPKSMVESKILNLRAEQLSIDDFVALTAKISSEWNL